MKLTSLLIQYLYTNERLDLPGIGIFTLDRNIIAGFDNPKNRQPITEGISFTSKPGLNDSPDLIRFISESTGKMKSLALADLESRMELAKQFLNLGKPFTFEGLGTLVRRTTGEVEFTQAFFVPDPNRPIVNAAGFQEREEVVAKHESVFTEPKQSGGISRPLMASLVIGGIALAIGAGYWISLPNNNEVTAAVNTSVQATDSPATTATDTPASAGDSTPPAADSNLAGTANTLPANNPPVPAAAVSNQGSATGNYKYVLEVAKSERILKRYKQLRTNLWNVEMETKDSIDYKLVLMLPKLNADTTRVLDSLTVMLGRKVYIEPQN